MARRDLALTPTDLSSARLVRHTDEMSLRRPRVFHSAAAILLLGLGCDADTLSRDAAPELSYEVDATWQAGHAELALGEVVGVAVDGDRIYLFHRAGAHFDNDEVIEEPTIAVLDRTSGALLDELGAGVFIVPHGLGVGPDGHLWATDVGNDTVVELSADGEVLRTLEGSP